MREYKIGEIFEYNGEWYQCVEHKGCYGCAFLSHNDCGFNGDPHCVYRSDSKHVIFKKLEKTGEQFLYKGKQMQSYIRATDELICNWNNNLLLLEHGDSNIIDIEIKQTKEDMEENKFNLKPFDIQKAREGKPVCTRDGRKARIICLDRVGDFPIVALTDDREYKEEGVNLYDINGKGSNECFDLMMLPEKKEGWINIYNADTTFYYVDGRVFETKDEAVQEAKEEVEKGQREKNEYIDTIRVEWEE